MMLIKDIAQHLFVEGKFGVDADSSLNEQIKNYGYKIITALNHVSLLGQICILGRA